MIERRAVITDRNTVIYYMRMFQSVKDCVEDWSHKIILPSGVLAILVCVNIIYDICVPIELFYDTFLRIVSILKQFITV